MTGAPVVDSFEMSIKTASCTRPDVKKPKEITEEEIDKIMHEWVLNMARRFFLRDVEWGAH